MMCVSEWQTNRVTDTYLHCLHSVKSRSGISCFDFLQIAYSVALTFDLEWKKLTLALQTLEVLGFECQGFGFGLNFQTLTARLLLEYKWIILRLHATYGYSGHVIIHSELVQLHDRQWKMPIATFAVRQVRYSSMLHHTVLLTVNRNTLEKYSNTINSKLWSNWQLAHTEEGHDRFHDCLRWDQLSWSFH